MQSAHHLNFRARGIPLTYLTKPDVRELIMSVLPIGPGASVAVHSLAMNPVDCNSKVATLSFHSLPVCLSGGEDQWKFALPSEGDEDGVTTKHTLTLDTHFIGFTPLQDSDEDKCDVDVITLSGLGGHAFGSFKERGGTFMWLRDALPFNFPNARILIYGYDTQTVLSSSFQNLTDLGKRLRTGVKGIRKPSEFRPILFIGHSLGGLVIKEAICKLKEGMDEADASILNSVSGFVFFGVPHLRNGYQVPRSFVLLKRLEEDFKNAFDGRHIDVVSFYETKKSPTAVEVADGRWELSGPPEVLVDGPSATYGSEPQHQHPIDRSHSEMVKYSNYYDELYTDVRTVLQPLLSKARSMRATVGVEAGHNLSLPHSTKSIVARESHFRVPFGRNRDFVGRESILAQLLRTIPPSVEVDDCQRTAIEGRGGVGKSQIALEAAFRVCDQFPGCSIFWVPAVDATSFENVYREIGRQLGIKGIEEDKADVKTLVKEALSRESSGHWLLIIDNADDPGLLFSGMALSDCLPFSRKGSVLFTTQRREVAVRLDVPERNIVTAEEMNEAEAMDLLLKGLNSHGSNLKDLKNLIIFLEKLPLAIKQASAYIAKTRMPVAKYLDHCKSSNKTLIKLLSKDFEDRGRYKGTEHPVAMTWLISFKRISRDNPVAAQYLKFISLLAEYDIPISLLPPASHQLEAHETIGILKAYAFITNRDTHDSFDMHRLVRLATRNWLDEKGKHKECVTEVILRLHQVFPLPQIDNKDTWIKYLPHLEAALGSRERSADKAASVLLRIAGYCCYVLASGVFSAYVAASVLLGIARYCYCVLGSGEASTEEATVNIAASVLLGIAGMFYYVLRSGEGTADEAASVLLGIAGYCYYVLGQYRKAEQKTRQGLELVQKLLDKEDPYVLSRMVILGYVLEAGGKYEEAEGVLRQAMDVQEKVLGKDHPDTLCTMDTLTAFLISQGKYEEAEGMLRRTVELREKAFGKEHPDTLSSLSDLAIVLKSQGKRENAVALMEKCHQLWVQEFGLDDCDARRSFKLLNDWKIEG